jgi:cyclopropane fatty-acyl-phospholipid synthase-like methyltransferase
MPDPERLPSLARALQYTGRWAKERAKLEEKSMGLGIRTLRQARAKTVENTGKKPVEPFDAVSVGISQPVADRNVQNLLKKRQSALDEGGAFPLG